MSSESTYNNNRVAVLRTNKQGPDDVYGEA